MLVANLQPLKPGEEDLALSFAIPLAPGLKILSRKSFEAAALSFADNPLSARFDENDALLWFEDAKVPWDPRARGRRPHHAAALRARLAQPEPAAIIEKTQRSPISGARERVLFLKLAWHAIGSEFGARHTRYGMFYAGAPSSPAVTPSGPAIGTPPPRRCAKCGRTTVLRGPRTRIIHDAVTWDGPHAKSLRPGYSCPGNLP